MKSALLFLCLLLVTAVSAQKINDLARGLDGGLIKNQKIDVRVTLISDILLKDNHIILTEEHQILTDADGRFELEIGTGALISSQENINVDSAQFYSKLEVKPSSAKFYRQLHKPEVYYAAFEGYEAPNYNDDQEQESAETMEPEKKAKSKSELDQEEAVKEKSTIVKTRDGKCFEVVRLNDTEIERREVPCP